MFLSKVKKTSPVLFWCLAAFCFLQVTFTFIKLEVTPFFLYGMYSEKFYLSDTVSIYKQKLNGYALQPKPFSRWRGDILLTGIENYNAQLKNNKVDVVDTRVSSRYPGIYSSPLFQAVKKNITNDSTVLTKFPGWCRRKIYEYTGEEIITYELIKETYLVNLAQKKYKLLSVETVFCLN